MAYKTAAPFGISFAPTSTAQREGEAQTGRMTPIQRAIQVLSLRLPETVSGPSAIAPGPVLQGGAATDGRMNAVLRSLLQQMAARPAGAPTASRSSATPSVAPFAPRVTPQQATARRSPQQATPRRSAQQATARRSPEPAQLRRRATTLAQRPPARSSISFQRSAPAGRPTTRTGGRQQTPGLSPDLVRALQLPTLPPLGFFPGFR